MADYISPAFYDLFAVNSHIPDVRKKLPPLLTGVRRSILEIGAGTGLITTSLAEWTPAEIFALEPSAAMRTVLLSRLAERPDLLERVTVLPHDALSLDLALDLAEPVEAMVMINVMYALEPGYRKRLWPVLAGRSEPGGLLILTWRDGGPPQPRPMRHLTSRQVGRHTYTVSSEIADSDDEGAECRYLYRITQGDKVLSEEELVGRAYRPTRETLREELVSAGYVQTDAPDGLLAWRRS
ncbi:methyltransferase domain-containing protein [Nonomuraea sp. NPDC052265]|uniref:methyltransferase domain-containing protein n=1 Tax=Nonomuraea sp. NPDC052265 TaxID=3364374 RepID=UPI0037C9A6A9